MVDIDSLYHRLFSEPLMVEELVTFFLPELLEDGLDLRGIERVNAKFHDVRNGRRREGDIIWRLRSRTAGDLFLYLMLEFQSRVDYWMAVRALVYQSLLLQQIVAERDLKPGDRLPPVVTVVLYNGDPRWTAATDLRDLIGLPDDTSLWPWQPSCRYHLLDMGAFTREALGSADNLAALLFRLEQPHDHPGELGRLVGEVVGWFERHPDRNRLRDLFKGLVLEAIEDLDTLVADIDDMREARTMLATQAQRWIEKWKSEGMAEGRAKGWAEGRVEGRAEGRAEGLAQGVAEGKIEAILSTIDARFGAVDSTTAARVRATSQEELDALLRRVLTADSLDAALGQAAQH